VKDHVLEMTQSQHFRIKGRQFNQASWQCAGTKTCIRLKEAVLRDGDFWQMVSDGKEAKER
jgi:hypothetical protein